MRLLIVINKNFIYTYKNDNQKYSIQYIEGSEKFFYSINCIEEDITSYINALANENNIDNKEEFEFDVIESAHEIWTKCVVEVLEKSNRILNCCKVETFLKSAIENVFKDKKNPMEEYGINYDGYSFKTIGENIVKNNFDLLAYAMTSKDILDVLNVK